LENEAIGESDEDLTEYYEYAISISQNCDSDSELSDLDSNMFGSLEEDVIDSDSVVVGRAGSEAYNEINDSELLRAQIHTEGVRFLGVSNVSNVLAVGDSMVGSVEVGGGKVASPPRFTRSGRLYRKKG